MKNVKVCQISAACKHAKLYSYNNKKKALWLEERTQWSTKCMDVMDKK